MQAIRTASSALWKFNVYLAPQENCSYCAARSSITAGPDDDGSFISDLGTYDFSAADPSMAAVSAPNWLPF